MKSPQLTLRDYLALLIGLASLAGLAGMFFAEGNVILSHYAAPMQQTFTEYAHKVLPGLQKYSLAIGMIMLAVSVAYILLGHEEDIATALNEQELKK